MYENYTYLRICVYESKYGSMTVSVYENMRVWMYGRMRVWVHGNMNVDV